MRKRAALVAILPTWVPAAAIAANGDVELGRALFETHCAVCHGPTGEDGESGDIRGLSLSVVARATRGIEAMPEFTFGEHEVEALVAYLAYLWER